MRAVCGHGVTALFWIDTLGGQNPLGIVVRAENNHTHVIPAASADRANGYSPVTTRAINHENRSKRSVEGQMYFFWAVSGTFIITTRGIFRFDVGIDATNPKKWRKNIMCTWKTAWPLLWHDHELRILAETIFFNIHRVLVSGSQKLCPAQNRLFTCTSVRSQEAIPLSNTPWRNKSRGVSFLT